MSILASRALILGATLFSLASASVFASGGDSPSKKPQAPVEFEFRGDAANGKTLSTSCAACHGADGNSMISAFPKLAGQHSKYIYKQLQDMHKQGGEKALRPVPEMSALVSSLTKDDMADLAAYFEQQKSTILGVDPELVALGEKIYRAGNKETNVPACTSCHQPDGSGLGLAGYPQLAGQYPSYTTKQLKAFRAAGRDDLDADYRVNDGEAMIMRMAAKGLSDKEIQAVSAYVSGLMSNEQKKLSMEKQ